ncbi:MAG TPA: GNAT family N-acetyltransferase [Puia sp.]|nr:GNAT family N-acetyltransferase [Puia sp.]
MKATLWEKDNFSISIDKYKLDVPYIHKFLSTSYWAENIPVETVRRSIEGSICFGVYHEGKQIGFARVVSDLATFAYLADVFIEEQYRGLGLAKRLMQIILSHPDLQGLRRFLLATRDAHGLYSQFGFVPLTNVDRWMQIHQKNVYKK